MSPPPAQDAQGTHASPPRNGSDSVGWMRMLGLSPQVMLRTLRYRAADWLSRHWLHHQPFDRRRVSADKPIDILVVVADHFEPTARRTPEAAGAYVEAWCRRYEAIADRYRDCGGRPPQHTWFYPADYPDAECLQHLSASAYRGFGEVEFHLHHGFDTQESFAAKLNAGLEWFQRWGNMLSAEPQPKSHFAYVAGNWALDNGAFNNSISGCDSELVALGEAGCYADFTFPALGSRAQPRKTNAIYYARHKPGPKSYNTGTDIQVGNAPTGDLLMFQGPLLVDWRTGRFEDGGLESWAPPSSHRLDLWLRANIHVKGRPEWIFVKLHTHAVQSAEAFLGAGIDAMLETMDHRWNRPPFRLHYVTAREAYNIAKAAEAGYEGNPGDFRNFLVPPPANRRIGCSAPWRLLAYAPDHLSVRFLQPGPVQLDCDMGLRVSTSDCLQRFDAWFQAGRLLTAQFEGEGVFEVATDRITRRFICDTLQRLRVTWKDPTPSLPEPGTLSAQPVVFPEELVTR